jgi:hypothetical protein
MAGVTSLPLPDSLMRELAEGKATAESARATGPDSAKAAIVFATLDHREVDLSSFSPDGVQVARNVD